MKKKKEKELTPKEEAVFNKVGEQLSVLKEKVRKNKGVKRTNFNLFEFEHGVCRCEWCMLMADNFDYCIWARENSCTERCRGFKKSIGYVGMVDSKRYKHDDLNDFNVRLRKKLTQYFPIAEKIHETLIREKERIEKEERKKLMEQRIKEMKELMEEDKEESNNVKEVETKRRNLKSLI
jgi:hypothetical protein